MRIEILTTDSGLILRTEDNKVRVGPDKQSDLGDAEAWKLILY